METILRSKEMAQIKLLPVRHHSPACALQVRKVINDWNPTAILIEGPENANALIPVMVHEDTKAPFAIYYSCKDKKGKISEEKGHYKCYYPFLDYSPELVALREADKNKIPAAFIDLSYGEILQASEAGKGLLKEEEKSNYNDDYLLFRSEYMKQLCEKTGLRNFDEFWEKYFELNGLMEDSDTWFSHLLTHCELSRKNTPKEELQGEGCLEREAHMAARILQKVLEQGTQEKRILVVTGGFHTPALKTRLSDEHWNETTLLAKKLVDNRKSDLEQSVYLMPYSMEAADALNGYASGMPFTGFYQKIWNNINIEKTDAPYERAVLDMLVASGKELRKKEEAISTYDEICALQMAKGLALLREKPQPGAYELHDAVMSSYVKGEYNLATDIPIRVLRRLMTGDEYGRLCSKADVPPIIHDFELQCRNFGLKTGSTIEREVTLSVFSGKKHRQMSMFFHRMSFLNTAFVRRIKGPNLQLKKDKNLIREIWKYKWSVQVNAALIDVSVHGATIEEAVTSIVQEHLRKDIGAGKAALLLTQVFEMGLAGQLEAVYERVHEQILKDSDFYSITDALKSLMMMEELGGLYESELEFSELIHTAVRKLITLLPSMTGIKDENLNSCMDALKLLYQITGRRDNDIEHEKDAYFEALDIMKNSEQLHPGLHGCIYGILYGSGREDSESVAKICQGYLTGTKEQLMNTAVFFRGLFYTAKDLVFIGDQLLKMLDSFFSKVDEDEFMQLLPQLRMAFAYFTPGEIDKIAGMAARLHGAKGEDITKRREILPEWYTYGKELDEYARAGIT